MLRSLRPIISGLNLMSLRNKEAVRKESLLSKELLKILRRNMRKSLKVLRLGEMPLKIRSMITSISTTAKLMIMRTNKIFWSILIGSRIKLTELKRERKMMKEGRRRKRSMRSENSKKKKSMRNVKKNVKRLKKKEKLASKKENLNSKNKERLISTETQIINKLTYAKVWFLTVKD